MEQARARETNAVCNLNTVLQMYLLDWHFFGGFSGQRSLCLPCYMLASSQQMSNYGESRSSSFSDSAGMPRHKDVPEKLLSSSESNQSLWSCERLKSGTIINCAAVT